MGIFSSLLGIDDKKAENQDRARMMSGWDAEWANLTKDRGMGQNLYGMGVPGVAAGQGTVGAGADYFKGVLGDRTQAAAAAAPETNAILAHQDALRQAQAMMGTARGGGVAGANQNANQATQGAITNATFAARPQAAQGAVQAGGVQAQIGSDQIAQALRSIGMSEQQIQHIINSSAESQKTSHELGKRTSPLAGLAKNLLGIATGGASTAIGNGLDAAFGIS